MATTVASLFLGLALLAALLLLGDVSLSDLARGFVHAPPAEVVLILIVGVVPLLTSAWKWRIVAERTGTGDRLSSSAFVLHTTSATLAGQILPPQVAASAVRGFAMRCAGSSFARGAVTSLFEQLFDLIVVLVLGLVAVALLTSGFGEEWSGAAAFIALALGGVLVVLGSRYTTRALSPLNRFAVGGVLGSLVEALALLRFVDAHAVSALYLLSCLRMGAAILRAGLVLAVLGLPSVLALIGTPLVQLAQLTAFTPGALGLSEWGWASVFALEGFGLREAAVFAVTLRLYGLATNLVVWLAAFAWWRHGRARGPAVAA